tara:strand:+ start:502 stop:837 length:336 start_codon:yes stop_codon:yes gene_type:complete
MSIISTTNLKIGIYTLVDFTKMVYIIRVKQTNQPTFFFQPTMSYYSKPYSDCNNVKSVYTTGFTKIHSSELTDDEIDSLINSESDDYKKPDIHTDLFGDDYADAMMKELGI